VIAPGIRLSHAVAGLAQERLYPVNDQIGVKAEFNIVSASEKFHIIAVVLTFYCFG
jgi:hypothetical protein